MDLRPSRMAHAMTGLKNAGDCSLVLLNIGWLIGVGEFKYTCPSLTEFSVDQVPPIPCAGTD